MSEQTIPFVIERAERDGCDCPPWVIRCAHFDGGLLVLAVPHGTQHDAHSNRCFAVARQLIPCPFCGELVTGWNFNAIYVTHDTTASDLVDAHAAFDAAELALLRGVTA